MSIRTIEAEQKSNTVGVVKKINDGAKRLVFDILQSTQYSTPIPSTVRELVTNACDAQREKEMAIEILTGAKTPEEYYITRHGEQYEDSNFDVSYYNLESLDKDNSEVEITYKHNHGVGYCDQITIKDYGVGIGGRRMEGILELGYSTKRNTSQNFGAFGLGAKVALSTGVDFYTIESVHNGRKIKANCYNYKTDFIIPKFNTKTGQSNPTMTLSDGSVVYYEETTDKNWTSVSFGVKKHNASRFAEAIREQLNYLHNVIFYETDEYGATSLIDFHSAVLYNSNNLIVSDKTHLSKPHIIIVKSLGAESGINYGYVDFRELEMQDLYGPVGLKCPVKQSYVNEEGETIVLQEGVEVTPSREKVIWNDSTKEYIQKLIDIAANEATTIVEEQLQQDDFLQWLYNCTSVVFKAQYASGGGSALQALSGILDTKDIKPKFVPDPSIKFTTIGNTLRGFNVKRHFQVKTDVMGADGEVKTQLSFKSEHVSSWADIDFNHVYYREESNKKLKDFYILESKKENNSSYTINYFFTIRAKNLTELEDKIENAHPDDVAALTKEYQSLKKSQDVLTPLIKSSMLCKMYADVQVPEEYAAKLIGEEEAIEQSNLSKAISNLSPAERRALNSEVVIYSYRKNDSQRASHDWSDWILDKIEPRLSDLVNTTKVTYYGTDEDSDKLLQAASILSPYAPSLGTLYPKSHFNEVSTFFYQYPPSRFKYQYGDSGWRSCMSPSDINQEYLDALKVPQVIKVNQFLVKSICGNPNMKHIDEFFLTLDADGNYTCDEYLKKFYTAKYCYERFTCLKDFGNSDFDDMDNCYNLSFIDASYEKIYSILYKAYKIASSRRTEGIDITEFTKLHKFQHFCSKDHTQEDKEELSSELFVLSDIPGADIFDYDFEEICKFADAFTEQSKHILSNVRSHNFASSPEQRDQITKYLKSVSALDVELPNVDLNSYI